MPAADNSQRIAPPHWIPLPVSKISLMLVPGGRRGHSRSSRRPRLALLPLPTTTSLTAPSAALESTWATLALLPLPTTTSLTAHFAPPANQQQANSLQTITQSLTANPALQDLRLLVLPAPHVSLARTVSPPKTALRASTANARRTSSTTAGLARSATTS